MEYIPSLLEKRKQLTAAVVSYLELQTLFLSPLLFVLRSSKITIFIETKLVFFIHTDAIFTGQDVVIMDRFNI